jgi:hypothetical protein
MKAVAEPTAKARRCITGRSAFLKAALLAGTVATFELGVVEPELEVGLAVTVDVDVAVTVDVLVVVTTLGVAVVVVVTTLGLALTVTKLYLVVNRVAVVVTETVDVEVMVGSALFEFDPLELPEGGVPEDRSEDEVPEGDVLDD